jgi:uncharacterized membrane protein
MTTYSWQLLPFLGSYTDYSGAYAINDSGRIVGLSYRESTRQAVAWDPISVVNELPSGQDGLAFDVGSNGHICGGASPGVPCVWTSLTASPTILDDGGYAAWIIPYGINGNGQVVGWNSLSGSDYGWLWPTYGSTHQILSPLPGKDRSAAYAINDSGRIVGVSYPFPAPTYWEASAPTTPYALPLDSGDRGTAWNISPSGIICGNVRIGGVFYGALWTPTPSGYPLTVLPGSNSTCYGVNDAGVAVGWSSAHACVWDGGVRTFLPEPAGAAESYAYEINADGWIVGEVADANYNYRAILWTPQTSGLSGWGIILE